MREFEYVICTLLVVLTNSRRGMMLFQYARPRMIQFYQSPRKKIVNGSNIILQLYRSFSKRGSLKQMVEL